MEIVHMATDDGSVVQPPEEPLPVTDIQTMVLTGQCLI